MSTVLWPPVARESLRLEEGACTARELQWLLESLRDTLTALKSGLEECATLLSTDSGAHTLVLSSLRSESIKGFVTRLGTEIVKGDVNLKLSSIRPPPGALSHKLAISTESLAPTIALEQLTTVRTLVNDSLDVIDISTWTGDPNNADFIAGQLRLLFDHVQEAKQTLKGRTASQESWWEAPLDEKTFDPPCPDNISFHLFVAEAAVVLQVRTLELASTPPHAESLTGLGLRDRLAIALGTAKTHVHEELGEIFEYKGEQVRVKEMLRVESQDPSLLAAMAKLSALEHSVAMSRKALSTVMDQDY